MKGGNTGIIKAERGEGGMIYLDNSATTQVDEDTARTACQIMTEIYGNPSSPYMLGRDALGRLTAARHQVAQVIGAPARRIFFTSGGTEANNLAIRGSVLGGRGKVKGRIITTAIEHSSVLASCRSLEEEGYEAVLIRPRNGRIQAGDVIDAVNEDTLLVSVMAVNNETGEWLPVEEIAKGVKEKNPDTLVHCDCVQGFGKIHFSLNRVRADMVTMSAHKIHGPKGCGAIYVREGVDLHPLCFGGSQESGVRPGTENVPGIAAFGYASEKALRDIRRNWDHVMDLNRYLSGHLAQMEDVVINSREDAVPYVLNISVLPFTTEELLHELRMRGIYVSGSSACEKGARSHVIRAMGIDGRRAESVLRIGLGKKNTRNEITVLIETLNDLLKRGKRK